MAMARMENRFMIKLGERVVINAGRKLLVIAPNVANVAKFKDSFVEIVYIREIMRSIEEIFEATNKKQKVSEDDQEDRLSNLPDSILLHILSFLPMEDAVKIVLLQRFGNLWTSLQTLNFDGRSYLNFSKSCRNKWFTEFVPHALLHHECHTIYKFSLKFGSYLYFLPNDFKPRKEKKSLDPKLASTIDSWIYFALRKKVKFLDLGILAHGSSSSRFDYDLPDAISATPETNDQGSLMPKPKDDGQHGENNVDGKIDHEI